MNTAQSKTHFLHLFLISVELKEPTTTKRIKVYFWLFFICLKKLFFSQKCAIWVFLVGIHLLLHALLSVFALKFGSQFGFALALQDKFSVLVQLQFGDDDLK